MYVHSLRADKQTTSSSLWLPLALLAAQHLPLSSPTGGLYILTCGGGIYLLNLYLLFGVTERGRIQNDDRHKKKPLNLVSFANSTHILYLCEVEWA